MNIYADRGNILFLQRRCEWRGIPFRYAAAGPGDGFDPADHDLIYIGGGQDRDQVLVAEDMLRTKRDAIASAVEDGAALLAVCGGYQLLGHRYQLGDESIPGLGIADLETVREPGPRLIGNVAIEVDLGDGPEVLAGFENHGGRTYLGPDAEPLGRVLHGHGNNGHDGHEGVQAPQPDRHLPARPPAAQERLARRPPDRARARAPHGLAPGAGAARRRARGRRPRFRPARGLDGLGSSRMVIVIVIVALLLLVGLDLRPDPQQHHRLRNQCDEAWSGIDVQLKRRHDLVPNLVESVKGYATHEQ